MKSKNDDTCRPRRDVTKTCRHPGQKRRRVSCVTMTRDAHEVQSGDAGLTTKNVHHEVSKSEELTQHARNGHVIAKR